MQADSRIAMGGVGAKMATPWGAFGLWSRVGRATSALVCRRPRLGRDRLFRYGRRSRREFQPLGGIPGQRIPAAGRPLITSSGILFPEFNYWLRLSGNYSTKLDDKLGLSLSARYQFADDKQPTYSPFTIKGDRYGADIALSRSFGPSVTGSCWLATRTNPTCASRQNSWRMQRPISVSACA